jgi:hypothetical protein
MIRSNESIYEELVYDLFQYFTIPHLYRNVNKKYMKVRNQFLKLVTTNSKRKKVL